MVSAEVPDEPPLTYADSFDVPVLFRNGPANKPRRQWRTAEHQPWAGSNGFPAADGWYAPTTTWREIIKAATEVGRDVTPHLQNQPRYAHGELVARVSPLYAYLGAHFVEPRHPVPGSKGRRLTWNPVYAHGTERSAKNAAGYRLGMTMTEWACRSLLGLGRTEHLELGGPIPALHDSFKDPKKKLPDLWGRHEAEAKYWLIEAKGATSAWARSARGGRSWRPAAESLARTRTAPSWSEHAYGPVTISSSPSITTCTPASRPSALTGPASRTRRRARAT